MERKKKRGWIWLVVIAVLIGGGVFAWRYFDRVAAQAQEAALASASTTYTVERGNIDTLVTASGSLSAEDTYTVNVPDGLYIDDIVAAPGDVVKKGDPIAVLNAASVQEQLFYLRKALTKEEASLETPGSYDSIKAPATGRLVYQPVLSGDDVLDAMIKYGVLAILSTDGFFRLEIQTDQFLALGNRMRVEWNDGAATGTVDRKTEHGYVILVPDSDAPYKERASLMDGEKVVGSGTLEVNLPVEVYGFDGVIRTVRYHVGESVPDGKELFKLKNASVATSFATHYSAEQFLSRQYKTLISYLIKPVIAAPEDGVVSEITFKEHARTGSTANADKEGAGYRLSVGSHKIMTVDVDELDVLKLSVGQHATVTLDALPDEPLSGEVTRISRVGKKNNSVSVFAVELTMEPDERLLAGMNGSATIEIDHAENVLIIPVAAILEDGEGAYVNRVLVDGTTARAPIATGRSNEDIAEVTSGLSEGDTISYSVAGDIDFMMMNTSVTVSSTEDAGSDGTTDGEG